MARILHMADLHLDGAFVGENGKDRARARREAQRALLREIVALGNREAVDLLLIAGDLVDGESLYGETKDALAEILGKSNARIFIAPGNHDPVGGCYSQMRLPENVHLFRQQAVVPVELPALNCVVWGAGFVTPACEASLLEKISAPEDDRCHILLLHGEVTEGASRYNPIRLRDLAQSNMTYAALGHVHTPSGVQSAGKTAYAYPGCPEGRGFDELGEKGVLLGTVEPGHVDLKFVTLPGYRYWEKTVPIAPDQSVLEQLSRVLPNREERGLYRMILTGESEPIALAPLYEALAERVYQLELIDRTTPVRSIWEELDAPGLKGAFLRRMRAALDQEEDQDAVLLATRFGLAALENREGIG